MILGFTILLFAGLCQGSFGLGYKKYHPFSWAAFWGIYCLLCIFVSAGVSIISAPGVLFSVDIKCFAVPLLCGAAWGLSAIGFSKSIGMIGMSMVYGISMGVSTVVGSLLPMVIGGSLPENRAALYFWAGLFLTLSGITVITGAGVMRDKSFGASPVGILLALFSGMGSGAMNVGFTYSEKLGPMISGSGYSAAAVAAFKWLPVLVGGCITGMIWCAAELCVKRQWHTICEKGSLRRTAILFGVSIIWYAALLLYGLSVQMLGDIGNTVGWILFNALALGVSVIWGIKTGEWPRGKRKILYAGCALLILSWVIISKV